MLNVTFSLYSSTEVNLKNEEGSFQLISKDSIISYKFEGYRPQVLRDLYLNSYVERKLVSYKHNFIIKYPKCHTQGIHWQCWYPEGKIYIYIYPVYFCQSQILLQIMITVE